MSNSIQFPVSEIFTSIQGEGNYAGVNSLFIRLQYCNLRCIWCDTKFTWTGEGKFEFYPLEKLKETIQKASQHHIIITGGEPLLHQIDQLLVPNKKIHVESNGYYIPTEGLSTTLPDGSTVKRKAMDEKVIANYNWVISPKLSNSRQPLNNDALKYWADKDFVTFKFIVRHNDDFREIIDLVQELNIKTHKVYLGLEGTEPKSQLNTNLVQKIIDTGFNFSPRLHVLFWGNERRK